MSRYILTLRNQQTAISKAIAITPGGTEATKLIPVSAVPRLADEKNVHKIPTPDAK